MRAARLNRTGVRTRYSLIVDCARPGVRARSTPFGPRPWSRPTATPAASALGAIRSAIASIRPRRGRRWCSTGGACSVRRASTRWLSKLACGTRLLSSKACPGRIGRRRGIRISVDAELASFIGLITQEIPIALCHQVREIRTRAATPIRAVAVQGAVVR